MENMEDTDVVDIFTYWSLISDTFLLGLSLPPSSLLTLFILLPAHRHIPGILVCPSSMVLRCAYPEVQHGDEREKERQRWWVAGLECVALILACDHPARPTGERETAVGRRFDCGFAVQGVHPSLEAAWSRTICARGFGEPEQSQNGEATRDQRVNAISKGTPRRGCKRPRLG